MGLPASIDKQRSSGRHWKRRMLCDCCIVIFPILCVLLKVGRTSSFQYGQSFFGSHHRSWNSLSADFHTCSSHVVSGFCSTKKRIRQTLAPLRAVTVPPPSKVDQTGKNGPDDAPQDGPVVESGNDGDAAPKIVLVAGFESFNRDLYTLAASQLPIKIDLQVFADSDIRGEDGATNPAFRDAVLKADAVICSLVFDYDDALAVKELLPKVQGPRLIFESADELMAFNRVGRFSMEKTSDGPSGPPPVVKAVLSKFSSGREEDKLQGYLKLLKIGPDLLKYIPGDKASDLRTWLEAYRYWNQGGRVNVASMLQLIVQRCLVPLGGAKVDIEGKMPPLPPLEVTPDVGLLHPLLLQGTLSKDVQSSVSGRYFTSPSLYLKWRLSEDCAKLAKSADFHLAPPTAPRVAILLFRKHVITEQKYIPDLITELEGQGLLPIPIFINGVEAHTIVRDLLTSAHEVEEVRMGRLSRESSFDASAAVEVDAIVNTIGFPLVGGPAGSMEAGRNVKLAEQLLRSMDVPYIVSAPLLLQNIPSWRSQGVQGLQSVVLYALPELDGAVDTTVLGGLVGDKIALVPERVRKLSSRIHGWVQLRQTPPKDRRIAISLYGFPPNVGAVGTAALLDVPQSLELILKRLASEGYDVGGFDADPDASGQSLVAALAVLCENPVITAGAGHMQDALDERIERAVDGDTTTAATLARKGGGLGGAVVRAFDVSRDQLDGALGKYMAKKVERAWSEKERGPGVSGRGDFVVSGLQLGNVWITVQPLLGVEGDPMRLLFERDLTPHPQYCAAYEWMKRSVAEGGVGAQAVIHLGMHGTVEWLPGLPLGNDRKSWADSLLGGLPNVYVYAANNPSESILAKRRGYGTLVSYNVPPYGRAGLYLDLANLKDLVSEYRMATGDAGKGNRDDLRDAIWSSCERCELLRDVPLVTRNASTGEDCVVSGSEDLASVPVEVFDEWVRNVDDYLVELQDRLFSSGLHSLGSPPTDEELASYLSAFYGDRLSEDECTEVIAMLHEENKAAHTEHFPQRAFHWIKHAIGGIFGKGEATESVEPTSGSDKDIILKEATDIGHLLQKNTEELDSVVTALAGGYVPPAPGGDLLRDGTSVLPTGRNIHALDPYRMPSAGAWARGQRAAEEILRQHRDANEGEFPETVAVTLWGLDAIKTRGESVAIVLALVGAYPVKEGTGRVVRFDLRPLEDLGRPRIDILASLSGIFRDSFANVVDLLDDMFERAASAENESAEMNFIKKHAAELSEDGIERPAARLFSNPPGDYGSMVNEVVGSGEWDNEESLGETWKGRNVFSYGKNEGGGSKAGTARPEVLDKLLSTTERVVQEIDSVEYGLTDIQEYYANTGALKKAAENRKGGSRKKKVSMSVIEAFGGSDDESSKLPVRDLQDVLRIEYRSKLLNPKWRDAMLKQGSGGAYEVSQRMTAMIGWAATDELDNFVFDQAAERYALDEGVAEKLRESNPEAFKNVVRRLLEASGRGMWEADEEVLSKLRDLYSEADDMVEQVAATVKGTKRGTKN